MTIEVPDDLRFLSELYNEDASEAVLLTEYPSSNSNDTRFQNRTQYIIHDPFPPPKPELLKCLGPHHLMCCWGNRLQVTSDVEPPDVLIEHWKRIFGVSGVPEWRQFDSDHDYITLFPHESLAAERQLIDPAVSYELHSKEIINQINCNQAKVFQQIQYPCIVKLSHGYAGLGNFILRNDEEKSEMRNELAGKWPNAKLVINSVIENIVTDHGVQFYLRKDGSMVWLGLTEQRFNESNRWCGGTYSYELQSRLIESYSPICLSTAKLLHDRGYFGLVGVDILTDSHGDCFLVDVNPRLTGITPFLMASRIFAQDQGFSEGVYMASFQFAGSLQSLIHACEGFDECQALVLSAVEEVDGDNASTICHLSVSSQSLERNRRIMHQLENYGI